MNKTILTGVELNLARQGDHRGTPKAPLKRPCLDEHHSLTAPSCYAFRTHCSIPAKATRAPGFPTQW